MARACVIEMARACVIEVNRICKMRRVGTNHINLKVKTAVELR
jgi:hypothetical protein